MMSYSPGPLATIALWNVGAYGSEVGIHVKEAFHLFRPYLAQFS